jgi:uncharacterized protein YbgA (DUF1722 family)
VVKRGQLMAFTQKYRNHTIRVLAQKLQGENTWRAMAHVLFFDDLGHHVNQVLRSSDDSIRTENEALDTILKTAKQWIDHRLEI